MKTMHLSIDWRIPQLSKCNTLQHTAKYCNTATHCNTLQHTATHCITLHHTATHCSTMQHTAAHYNTLQRTLQHTATIYFGTLENSQESSKATLCRLCMKFGMSWLLRISWCGDLGELTHITPLRHTSPHCNMLQHAATCCNTLGNLLCCVCKLTPSVCSLPNLLHACVTWHIHMCAMMHSYVWHDSFICVTWLIHMWAYTHNTTTR